MNELETARALLDKQAASIKSLIERAEKAEHDLNEWERGDVAQANRLMADRCVNAEHVARNATARAEKAEAALAAKAAESERRRLALEDGDADEARLERAVATARAVMAEEAARKSESYGEIGMRPAAEIRALAPLPAGLMVLPVEVMKEVREALEWGRIVCIRNRDETHLPKIELARVKAFAALDAAGGGR